MRIEVETSEEAIIVAKALADYIEKGLVASGFRYPASNEQRYYTEQREILNSLRRIK